MIWQKASKTLQLYFYFLNKTLISQEIDKLNSV